MVRATPSVAAMAIAAHESGHAIQDAVDYTPLESRSRLAMLRSAALTYVAGVASAAGYIIYLAFLGGRWFARKPPTGAPPFKPQPAV